MSLFGTGRSKALYSGLMSVEPLGQQSCQVGSWPSWGLFLRIEGQDGTSSSLFCRSFMA